MNIRSAVIAAIASYSLGATAPLVAQSAAADAKPHWTLLVPSGVIVPTGEQRHAIKRGNVSAVQIAFVARPHLAITSTLGWARSRDVATVDNPKLDVFTYDVGAEARAPEWLADGAATLTPFAGLGVGGRSYNYRELDVDATHNAGVYLSAGSDVRIRRVGIRLEARDYVTGFKPLTGHGASRTGNDVVMLVGLRLFAR